MGLVKKGRSFSVEVFDTKLPKLWQFSSATRARQVHAEFAYRLAKRQRAWRGAESPGSREVREAKQPRLLLASARSRFGSCLLKSDPTIS